MGETCWAPRHRAHTNNQKLRMCQRKEDMFKTIPNPRSQEGRSSLGMTSGGTGPFRWDGSSAAFTLKAETLCRGSPSDCPARSLPPQRCRIQHSSTGASLAVQWLGLRASTAGQGARVPFLVGELRSHKPRGALPPPPSPRRAILVTLNPSSCLSLSARTLFF